MDHLSNFRRSSNLSPLSDSLQIFEIFDNIFTQTRPESHLSAYSPQKVMLAKRGAKDTFILFDFRPITLVEQGKGGFLHFSFHCVLCSSNKYPFSGILDDVGLQSIHGLEI